MAAQALEAIFSHGSQEREDYTPSGAAIANGEIVPLGSGKIGICTSPEGIADGVLGSLATTGYFKIKKAESVVTFARGVLVGWDNAANTAVANGSGINAIGTAEQAAIATQNHVLVDINKGLPVQTP